MCFGKPNKYISLSIQGIYKWRRKRAEPEINRLQSHAETTVVPTDAFIIENHIQEKA
jgi:hypothetical protein